MINVITLLKRALLDAPVDHFADEHGHRVLEHVFADAGKVMLQGDVTGSVKT